MLDSVREEVREGFVTEARSKLLQAKVQALAALAMKTGNLAEAGKAAGHSPVTAMPLKRGEMNDVFSAALVGQLFGAPPGAVITGAAGKGNGYVIARVVRAVHPEPDVSSADYAIFRKSAAQQLDRDRDRSATLLLRESKAGVSVHQATVQRILARRRATVSPFMHIWISCARLSRFCDRLRGPQAAGRLYVRLIADLRDARLRVPEACRGTRQCVLFSKASRAARRGGATPSLD